MTPKVCTECASRVASGENEWTREARYYVIGTLPLEGDAVLIYRGYLCFEHSESLARDGLRVMELHFITPTQIMFN
jgi:hypothetical protein